MFKSIKKAFSKNNPSASDKNVDKMPGTDSEKKEKIQPVSPIAETDEEITSVVTAEITPEHEARLKKRILKNIQKGYLAVSNNDEEKSVQEWFEYLSDPREKFNDIIAKWYDENEYGPRKVRVAFTLNSNPDNLNKFAARYTPGTPYNALHAALRVYNQIIDWRNNSLAYPRDAGLTKPLILLSLGEITIERIGPNDFHSAAIDALCEGIRVWNLTKKYEMFSCNCAHFYEDMLLRLQKVDPAIGIPKSQPNDRAVELFLKRVKKGKIDKTITQEMFDFPLVDLKGKRVHSITFTSHSQLDIWANKHNTNGNLKNNYKSLRELLKSFDRAFQRDLTRFGDEQRKLTQTLEELRQKANGNPTNTAIAKELELKQKEWDKMNEIIGLSTPAGQCAFPTESASPVPTLPSYMKSESSGSSGQSAQSGLFSSTT